MGSTAMVRWGIIGCGEVCERKSGPAFGKVPNSQLVAVMRRNAAKAADYAQRHNVAHWHADAQGILANPNIDAVYVATPPSSHKEYAISAMRAGKAVYVEKPMANTYADCLEMIRVSEETGVPLFVAHYRRALPYFRKVREIVEGGAIGKPLLVNIQYVRAPSAQDISAESLPWRLQPEVAVGGYLFDLAPHTVDIVEYIVGQIAQVSGHSSNLAGLYGVEDTVTASFRFENGALGTASWCFVASPHQACDTIEIVGSRGEVSFSTFRFSPIVLRVDGATEEFSFQSPEHIQQPLIQTIVDELRGQGTCPSHGEQGARAVWFMERVLGRI